MLKQNAGTNGSTKIFVNLPVKDLKKTTDFFSKLGFEFNPVFTDENAACMVISEDIYAMLLLEKFFKSFIPDKEICDAKSSSEALLALSTKTREEVDELIKKAVAAGGLYLRCYTAIILKSAGIAPLPPAPIGRWRCTLA